MRSCHHLVKIIPHNKVLFMWTLWFCTFLWIHAYGVCVKKHSSRAKPSVYLLWCACLLVWLLADCHHRGSSVEGDNEVWLITVLSVSCFHSIFFAFLSLSLSFCVTPSLLPEDLDDLRMEGVTGLVLSGSKFSQGRSSYQPEPQAKVTLNICSRCAR